MVTDFKLQQIEKLAYIIKQISCWCSAGRAALFSAILSVCRP